MLKNVMEYANKKVVEDVYLKEEGCSQKIIGRDAVMNIVGKHFVIYCGGKEIFRQPHRRIDGYIMQSGNGMEFIYNPMFGASKKIVVHFVQDVKTPKWHNQTR